MGLRVEQGSAVSEIYRKACAFDMASWRVDGTDVLAVRDAIQRAAALAREQHEPSLVEAISFRFRGHSVVDPDRYRNPEEVKAGRKLMASTRSEEHTSELQSHLNLVCRLLLEKK